MNDNLKSKTLVTLQFLLIGLLLIFTPIKSINITTIIIIVLAIALAVWAIKTMASGKFRIQPIPDLDAKLIVSGPYKWIRHPMYSAIFLGVTGLFSSHFSWLKIFLFIALIIVLTIKLLWEEKMLNAKFADYEIYKQQTKRIIPYIL